MNVLDRIVAGVREEVQRRQIDVPIEDLERAAAARDDFRPFEEALSRPGLSVIATPGHTVGHQCVVVSTVDGQDVLIGDAAYTPKQFAGPPEEDLPPGQAADPVA